MVIDVRQGGALPAGQPVGEPLFDVLFLSRGEPSRTLAAAVAASCGLRPDGFRSQLASRPERRVHGWGAVVRTGGAAPPGSWPPESPASLAGVILLAESLPSGGGAAWHSIPWLLVHPDSRRLGMGRALVAAALDHAQRLGAIHVSIDTLDRWPEAVAFWRGMGFRPVGPAS
jgi:GNAT superfamily N-acetyltransferase